MQTVCKKYANNILKQMQLMYYNRCIPMYVEQESGGVHQSVIYYV